MQFSGQDVIADIMLLVRYRLEMDDVAKILVVDDERVLLDTLRYNLLRAGYEVLAATDGEAALRAAKQERPDLIILDVMLPKIDGFEVCRILRQERLSTPVLMLTARDEEVDKVLGLELGADDYLTKPFSMRELMARIKAMLRRVELIHIGENEAVKPLKEGDLTIDIDSHQAFFKGAPLHLKPKEFDLLAFLMRNRGRAFTRDQLLAQVWGYEYAGDTRTVDVHIRWLREKVERDPSNPELVETVRGVGYRFKG